MLKHSQQYKGRLALAAFDAHCKQLAYDAAQKQHVRRYTLSLTTQLNHRSVASKHIKIQQAEWSHTSVLEFTPLGWQLLFRSAPWLLPVDFLDLMLIWRSSLYRKFMRALPGVGLPAHTENLKICNQLLYVSLWQQTFDVE